jgi:cytochrome P450
LEFINQNVTMTRNLGDMLFEQKEYGSPTYVEFERNLTRQYEILRGEVAKVAKEYSERGEDFWKSRPEGRVKPFFAWQYDDVLSGKISYDMFSINVEGFLIFGVDITSGALFTIFSWLARKPRVLKKIREELAAVAGTHVFSKKILDKTPYLHAVIREAHRLLPISYNEPRFLDVDVVLDSANGKQYLLPKGTLVNWSSAGMSYDPSLFTDVLEFVPERWLEEPLKNDQTLNHPLMTMPWGAGPRMCIGARIAEIELRAIVAEVVRRADVELADPNATWEVANRMGNFPAPMPAFVIKPLH